MIKKSCLNNKGYSLLETIVSILIVGIFCSGALISTSKIEKEYQMIQTRYEEMVFINNLYELFDQYPMIFQETIVDIFGNKWDGNTYYYNHNIKFIYEYKELEYTVTLFYQNKMIEEWRRVCV